MESDELLVVHAVPHPSAQVQQVGFPLDHPYVELCWMSAIGPTATALLRKLPMLWRVAEPARVPAGELAASLGVSARAGLERAVRRLQQFGCAQRTAKLDLEVYTHLPPLPGKLLGRAPALVVGAHERLLDTHLRELAGMSGSDRAGGIRARLDRHQATATRSPLARPPLSR